MKHKETAGHLAAVFTVIIWGTTFISTKILLEDFKPLEILIFRFIMGFLALAAVNPRRLKNTTRPMWALSYRLRRFLRQYRHIYG